MQGFPRWDYFFFSVLLHFSVKVKYRWFCDTHSCILRGILFLRELPCYLHHQNYGNCYRNPWAVGGGEGLMKQCWLDNTVFKIGYMGRADYSNIEVSWREIISGLNHMEKLLQRCFGKQCETWCTFYSQAILLSFLSASWLAFLIIIILLMHLPPTVVIDQSMISLCTVCGRRRGAMKSPHPRLPSAETPKCLHPTSW